MEIKKICSVELLLNSTYYSADFVVVLLILTLPKMIGQTVASFLDRIFSIFFNCWVV